jgi:hypothetical protein
MKGQDNSAAIKGVYDALDRKVAAQMQDLDMRAKGLAVQRQGLDFMREQGKDRLEQLDTLRLASIQQAARKIEAIKVQTSVPAVRAAADEVLAGLSVKHAEVLGTAQERWRQQKNAEADRAQAAQFHKEQMGFQWAQLQHQREVLAVQTAEKLVDRKDAAGAARAKLIGEQAIIDPNTKDYLLTPQGQAKMQAADSVEAQMRKDPTKPALAYVARLRAEHPDAKDPAHADINALEARVKTDPQVAARAAQEYANSIRDDARLNDAAIALNKKTGEEAQKAVAIAHDMSLKVDKATKAIEADPSPANREAWASIQTQAQFIKGAAAKGLGEKVSVRAMEALDHVLSIDPDSVWSRAVDKGKAIAAMKTLREVFNQDAASALGSAGIKGAWKPADITPASNFEGQTAQEIASDADPGWFTQYVFNPIYHPIDTARGKLTPEALKEQAFNEAMGRTGTLADGSPGRPSNYGLDPRVESTVDSLVKRAGAVGHAEYGRIVDDISGNLSTAIAGDKARPSLAIGVARKLQDDDPALLDAVLSNIEGQPGGGKVKADAIRSAIEVPKLTPSKSGGLTPAAAADLAQTKERVARGLPAYPQLSPPAPGPMRDLTPDKLPGLLRALPPEARAKAIEWMKANGLGAGAQ